jgi:hypothetical protein
MTGIAGRSTKLLALAGLLLAVTTSSGSAASPQRGRILGVVPHSGPRAATPQLFSMSKAAKALAPAPLTFDAGYESLINQYFTDVAHDSGGSTNVYSAATQYADGSGAIQYQSAFGGSYVDTDPLPPNGCHDGVDTYCLTDRQLQHEIQAVLTATGWHGGLDHMFFLMTPNGVGSCSDALGTECTTGNAGFCAYHNYFVDSKAEYVIYADEPYMGPSRACTDGSQGFPNGVDADTTINTISHEHNEAITDPITNPGSLAWIAADGSENGDLCAYSFGAQTGTGAGAYNQVINGHQYDLQEEFSNAAGPAGGCVQYLGGPSSPPPLGDGTGPLAYRGGPVMHTNTTYAIYWLPTVRVPAARARPHISGRARVGRKLLGSHGSWTDTATYRYQWLRCNSHGASCSSIPHATHSTYRLTRHDAGHRLRLRVTATNPAGTAVATSAASSRVRH